MDEIVLRDIGDLESFRGNLAAPNVRIERGEIAVDALAYATAEDLLKAFRGSLSEADAKTIVGILLDNELTWDAMLEWELKEQDWLRSMGIDPFE